MNRELLELRWGRTIDQKMAAVHGKFCMIPPLSNNRYIKYDTCKCLRM
jgi:hypothetical protein